MYGYQIGTLRKRETEACRQLKFRKGKGWRKLIGKSEKNNYLEVLTREKFDQSRS